MHIKLGSRRQPLLSHERMVMRLICLSLLCSKALGSMSYYQVSNHRRLVDSEDGGAGVLTGVAGSSQEQDYDTKDIITRWIRINRSVDDVKDDGFLEKVAKVLRDSLGIDSSDSKQLQVLVDNAKKMHVTIEKENSGVEWDPTADITDVTFKVRVATGTDFELAAENLVQGDDFGTFLDQELPDYIIQAKRVIPDSPPRDTEGTENVGELTGNVVELTGGKKTPPVEDSYESLLGEYEEERWISITIIFFWTLAGFCLLCVVPGVFCYQDCRRKRLARQMSADEAPPPPDKYQYASHV